MIIDEDNQKEDYFDAPAQPEPEKKPKEPVYKPDDPRYWDQEESEFEHLRPTRKSLIWWWVAAAAVALGLGYGAYLRYFSPYQDQCVAYGYVEDIRREGSVFKTFEGVILPYKDLMDTTRVYRQDFVFSAADGKVAADLLRMQIANKPVRVSYKRYHGALPWRGLSTVVIDSVDSVSPSRILPPEFAPDLN